MAGPFPQTEAGTRLKLEQVLELCEKMRDCLIQEPNVLEIQSPVTVVGDIHGQFYDLIELLKIGRHPDTGQKYVFLGDFVDRGSFSLETLLLLFNYKLAFKDQITLLRGNHECRHVTQVYGFYDECLKKYGTASVWQACTDVFDLLPLAAVIDRKVFCVHGGLSPSLNSLDEIRALDRNGEIPQGGPLSDLMWSDPEESTTSVPDELWGFSPRGAGFLFGRQAVERFNQAAGVDMILRSHQLVQEGFKLMFDGKLCTVWSAPNYCYRCGNVAAIAEVSSEGDVVSRTFKVFEASQEIRKREPNVPDYFL